MSAIEQANSAKAAGNKFLKEEKYANAIAEYNKALQLVCAKGELAAICFLNRSLAKKALADVDGALEDLNESILEKPDYTKALIKRAGVLESLMRYTEALNDLEEAKRLGVDAETTALIEKQAAAVQRKFEAATASKTKKPAPPPPNRTTADTIMNISPASVSTNGGLDGLNSKVSGAQPFLTGAEYAELLTSYKAPLTISANSADASDSGDVADMDPPVKRQRFDVARLSAQYQIRGLRPNDSYALLPYTWWKKWCDYVGGFSDGSDVAACVRLIKAKGTAAFQMDDPAVLKEYPALLTATPSALHPGPIDTRTLIASLESHLFPIPEEFVRAAGGKVFPGGARDAGRDEAALPAKVFLKRESLEGEHFILVGWQLGDMLAAWYGVQGPMMYRKVVQPKREEGEQAANPVIDLFPELHRYDGIADLYEDQKKAKEITNDANKKLASCCVCSAPAASKCSRCHSVHYCGQACQRAHWPIHKADCGSDAVPTAESGSMHGLVGLDNLGNTWHVMPLDVKRAIGSFQERFSGFAQHDAQELLNYVLDGIHEDLNRVKEKKYVEDEEANGRPDAIVAADSWEKYLRRNRSVVVDLFGGQLKSTLVCPRCEKVSVKFDPYHMLSVPLPTASRRTLLIRFERLSYDLVGNPIRWAVPNAARGNDAAFATSQFDKEADILRPHRWELHAVVLDKSDKFRAIKASIAGETGVAEDRLLIYRSRNDGDMVLVDGTDAEIGSVFQDYDETLYAVELCPPSVRPLHVPEEHDEVAVKSTADDGNGAARLLVLVQHLLPSSILKTTESLATWQPSEKEVSRLLADSESPLQNNVISIPRAASVAQLRYLVARNLFRYVNKEKLLLLLRTEEGDNAAETLSDAALIYRLAKILPLAVPNPGIAGAKAHWLPSFDGVSELDGRTLRVDAPEACAVAPWSARSKQPFAVTVLACTWRGAWFSIFDPKAADSSLSTPSLRRAIKEKQDRESGRTNITLEQCWERFTQPETLDEANTWYCPGCKEHVQARKTLEVWSLPEVLIVHLKRFEARGLIWRDKLTVPVAFPLQELDLTDKALAAVALQESGQAVPRQVYDCIAVVNHFGSMMFGHYTAFANHDVAKAEAGAAASPGAWYDFDDSRVSPISAGSVASAAAYILVYKRRKATP